MDHVNSAQHAELVAAVEHLVQVVARLRSPDGGCPWDLEQTQESLIPYVIEEAYETVDAIRSGQQTAICEELGDLLLQVVLQSQVASDAGHFTLKDVAEGISSKLIRRHPHVFGELQVDDVEQIRQNWEQIKAQEKGEDPNAEPPLTQNLKRYGRSLPPLAAAMKISQKAAAVGFEWDSIEGVWEKFEEELAELKEALNTEDKAHQESELGDLLVTLINIARWYDLDPSNAIQGTNARFIQRLELVETFADRPLTQYTLAEFEELWQRAKAKLANRAESP
ncbi:MAG TPA: nucleoside triphosphate pyrophosphohydrolase [Leptolyngbyaceae cyanobacterium M33_DOE_097]|uniref:Nucleoside triphosphate pyrophosphohydrolase n=1 Tax=Oscillatoriales cyanobacterium SpSt-418 TaxID=2282169 RepID=A0A7C3PKF6_9CYAN|nr:nucleoside triphosphate pyrophosphohydrolase [Leptolyngbyaceae cyanobacterium M33_DOE_097]